MADSSIESIHNSDSESRDLLVVPEPGVEPKLEILKQLVDENCDKIIIFTRFLKTADMLQKNLKSTFKEKNIVVVHAGTKDKDVIRKKFNDTDEIDIVIATDTWQSGISLDKVNYLIHYDINPSIESYLQKNDRIYRINSTHTKVIFILVGDLIETHIMDLLEAKLELIEKVTEGKAGVVNDEDIKRSVVNKLGW